MNNATPNPSLDEVLDAFAVEPVPSRATLEDYLGRYPEFADALIDLSRELCRETSPTTAVTTAEDKVRIDAAWRRHVEAGVKTAAADPFAVLTTDELRNVAKTLKVPRQVITAFRDRRVVLESVPRRFLLRLADALNTSLDALMASLAPSATLAPTRSYKADVKPSAIEPAIFERVLTDAGVPVEERARLLSEVD